MRRKFYKKCIKSTLLTTILIMIVSSILIVKDETFTLIASNKIESDKQYVYPIGLPVGLYLETEGVLIVDVGVVEDENLKTSNPLKGIVKPGDYLIKFNNEKINSKAQLISIINKNKNKEAVIELKRDNEKFTTRITPIKTKSGQYMIGVWVRDDTQGLGTLTCVTDNNKFVGLGHGISDIDTSTILNIEIGKLYKANIWGIKKGEEGNPGGICGSIEYKDENIIGSIKTNSITGISGNLNCKLNKEYNLEKMEVADKEEATVGEGKIQLILDEKVEQYSVNIISVNTYSKEKGMVIEITDKRLLDKTNGIVQGMSGSPIIQNGKIIGAVTHVLVNEPAKGYGIFIEEMLD